MNKIVLGMVFLCSAPLVASSADEINRAIGAHRDLYAARVAMADSDLTIPPYVQKHRVTEVVRATLVGKPVVGFETPAEEKARLAAQAAEQAADVVRRQRAESLNSLFAAVERWEGPASPTSGQAGRATPRSPYTPAARQVTPGGAMFAMDDPDAQ